MNDSFKTEHDKAPEGVLESRRDFLKLAGTTLTVIGLASVGLADDDDNEERGNISQALGKGVIDLGVVSDFKMGVTDKSQQAGVLISRSKQGLIALVPVCTHQGCTAAYSGAAAQFVCPCHAARFAQDGAVTAGPARAPLSRYPLQVKNGHLLVDTNKLVQRSSVKATDFLKV